MAKRPEHVDPQVWRRERERLWRRRNRLFNYLILAVSAALLVRWWFFSPAE
jgi:hypothetical protein